MVISSKTVTWSLPINMVTSCKMNTWSDKTTVNFGDMRHELATKANIELNNCNSIPDNNDFPISKEMAKDMMEYLSEENNYLDKLWYLDTYYHKSFKKKLNDEIELYYSGATIVKIHDNLSKKTIECQATNYKLINDNLLVLYNIRCGSDVDYSFYNLITRNLVNIYGPYFDYNDDKDYLKGCGITIFNNAVIITGSNPACRYYSNENEYTRYYFLVYDILNDKIFFDSRNRPCLFEVLDDRYILLYKVPLNLYNELINSYNAELNLHDDGYHHMYAYTYTILKNFRHDYRGMGLYNRDAYTMMKKMPFILYDTKENKILGQYSSYTRRDNYLCFYNDGSGNYIDINTTDNKWQSILTKSININDEQHKILTKRK